MNRMNARVQQGFSLMELMIAVAVIALLSAIALPMYTNYVLTAEQAVLTTNISSIEIFQEDFRLRTGNYLTVAADVAAIEAAIDWTPEGDTPGTTYSIAAGAGGTYEVTATTPNGLSLCLRLPDGVSC